MYGVGVIGSGPGAWALHLPTIERLAAQFRVVHISDTGSGRAAELAATLGARSSAGEAELLADPEVDVVLICSPPAEHARQVIAAAEAGARAILCEKPLALTEADAERAVRACREAGTALLVGTNHHFDPAWDRAKHHLGGSGSAVRSVSVTMALPPNDRYHALVAEPPAVTAAPVPRGAPDWDDPHVAGAILRQLILGLGIHDLPAVRDLLPSIDAVVYARPVAPIGYTIGAIAGAAQLRLTAVMLPEGADALWRLTVITEHDRLDVEFPPSFVHAGPATIRVSEASGRSITYPRRGDDGYLAEWRALAALLDADAAMEYEEILDDARFAIRLADAVAEVAGQAAGGRGER